MELKFKNIKEFNIDLFKDYEEFTVKLKNGRLAKSYLADYTETDDEGVDVLYEKAYLDIDFNEEELKEEPYKTFANKDMNVSLIDTVATEFIKIRDITANELYNLYEDNYPNLKVYVKLYDRDNFEPLLEVEQEEDYKRDMWDTAPYYNYHIEINDNCFDPDDKITIYELFDDDNTNNNSIAFLKELIK